MPIDCGFDEIGGYESPAEITRLCDLPIEWARQHQTLGLAAY